MQDWTEIDVASPPLSPASNREEYELHCAALEWSLADPIVLESEKDIQSKPDWRDGFEPFHHQVTNLVTFCKNLPVMLIADDVGLGKTISAAIILTELMKRRKVSRSLVLCPKILCPQWVEELESKVGIFGRAVYGGKLDDELKRQSDVVVTTYHSALSRLKHIGPGDFDMLIIDEAHKLRNLHGTKSPPRIATELRRVLQQRQFKYVLMLTATPMQNRLWDLYSLVDLLTVAKGHRNPLGTPEEFSIRYLADKKTGRQIRPDTRDEFQRIFRQYVQRTRRVTANLPFPERDVRMFNIPSTLAERQLLKLLKTGLSRGNALVKTSLATALMSSPNAFVSQLENMNSDKSFYMRLASEARNIMSLHEGLYAKEKSLLALIEDLKRARPKDWRLVIFTTRRVTQSAIGKLLSNHDIRHGFIAGSKTSTNQKTIQSFMGDKPEISVVVSTDAGAEGVNLQKCNVLVNYDLPWNPMVVEQRIGRIQRLRSSHKYVTIINLCLADSPEQHVVGRLMEKLQTISQTVGDIEAILESNFGESKDLEKSFREQVLKLVTNSLEGQNIEESTQAAEQSILDGKQLLQQQQEEIDNQFGNLDELKRMGPKPPKLTRSRPNTPYRSFVLGTLGADGGRAVEDDSKLVEVFLENNRNERWAFDEATYRQHVRPGHFAGLAPKLFVPGRPDFERLVQHWVDRSALYLEVDNKTADTIAKRWLSEETDIIVDVIEFIPESVKVKGLATVKASASNAVDSYEKLLRLAVESDEEHKASLSNKSRSLQSLAPLAIEQLKKMVVEDKDIKAFRKFYLQRLEDEQESTGDSPQLKKKVEDDFAPSVLCEVVGFEGKASSVGSVDVTYSVEGKSGFKTELRLSPERGHVLEYPLIAKCEETGIRVPKEILEKCAITKKNVLSHLLAKSDETGVIGLANLLVRCERSDRSVFPNELFACAVTGKRVSRSQLKASAVSKELALEEAMRRCSYTGDLVLPSELEKSQVSGESYRNDEQGISKASGVSGHKSEFIACEETGDSFIPDEIELSDLSGKRIWAELLVSSDKQPFRKGLENETSFCEVSKKRLLRDEGDTSDASGKWVDKGLLVKSASGKGRALQEELVLCEYSDKSFLASELFPSDVSGRLLNAKALVISDVSGKQGAPDEMTECEFTGSTALKTEIAVSDVSAKQYRIDEQVKSDVSGRLGHRNEFMSCKYTDAIAASDELEESALTSKLCVKKLLVASQKSGRLGVEDSGELVNCEASSKRLLTDEMGYSDASGKCVDVELLVESESGQGKALSEELKTCEYSGRRLLPSELAKSDISGRLVESSSLVESTVSGKLIAPDEVFFCDITGKIALESELVTSEISGKRYLATESSESVLSGTKGHHSELSQCDYTNKTATAGELSRSDLTGKPCLPSLLIKSEKSGRLGVESHDEIRTCEASGKRMLSDEVAKSDATGKIFDVDLIVKSDSGAGCAIVDELVYCAHTGRRLLPRETFSSELSGAVFDLDLLVVSAVSGKSLAKHEAMCCEFTGAFVLSDELKESEISHKSFRIDQQKTSDISGRTGHITELHTCEFSGSVCAEDESSYSDLSGKRAVKKLLIASSLSGRFGVEEAGEIISCEATGAILLADEVGMSATSNRRIDNRLLHTSPVSDIVSAEDEMVCCSQSNVWFMPDEVERCTQTSELCDKRLIVSSDSGKRGLRRLLRSCDMTDQSAFKDELGICQISKRLVLKNKLQVCEVTGKIVAEDMLARSPATGRLVLKETLVTTKPYGLVCARDETVHCPWSDYLSAEVDTFVCHWTGLRISKAFEGKGQRLAALEKMFLSQNIGEGGEGLVDWIEKQLQGVFSGITQIRFVRGPSKTHYAVFCSMTQRLGTRRRFGAFIVRINGKKREIVGKATIFKIKDNKALVDKQIDVSK